MQRFHVDGQYFFDIHSGAKVAEGRAVESRMASVPDGTRITLWQNDSSYEAIIAGRKEFPSVEEMLKTIGVQNMLPDTTSVEAGIAKYLSYGVTGRVVALRLVPVTPIVTKID